MTKSGGFKLLVMLSSLMLGMLPSLQTQSQTSNDATAPQPVFRDRFTLKLRVGKGHDYRQQFDKVPYVADNVVYLFAGDKFGVNVSINGDEIQTLTYQKDPAKADVDFRFEQKDIGGRPMMLLIITSKLKRRLFMDAAMTVPEKKELYKTSILPLEPGLPDFESWPHPIVQLVLRNFRFAEQAPAPESK